MRFLIRDRDAKYTGSFDEVVRSEGAEVIVTPMRSPKANAFAERSVRIARHEVLDHVLVLECRHLDRVLCTFERHYNAERPHRGSSFVFLTARVRLLRSMRFLGPAT